MQKNAKQHTDIETKMLHHFTVSPTDIFQEIISMTH